MVFFLNIYTGVLCSWKSSFSRSDVFPIVLLHKFQQKVNLNVLRNFTVFFVDITFDIAFLKVSPQLVK